LDAQVVEQRSRVRGHLVRRVVRLVIAFGRGAMAAIVERNHAVAGIVQRFEPAGREPIDVMAGSEAVNQKHGVTRSGRGLAIEEGKIKAVMAEELHRLACSCQSDRSAPGVEAREIAGCFTISPSVMPFLAAMPALSSSTNRTGSSAEMAASE